MFRDAEREYESLSSVPPPAFSLQPVMARTNRSPALERWMASGVKVVRKSWIVANLLQPKDSPLMPTDGHELLLQPPANQAQDPPEAAAARKQSTLQRPLRKQLRKTHETILTLMSSSSFCCDAFPPSVPGGPPPQGAAAAAEGHHQNPEMAKWLRWFGLEAFDNPEAFAARPKIGKLLQVLLHPSPAPSPLSSVTPPRCLHSTAAPHRAKPRR